MLDSIEVEMADGRPYEIRGMMRNLHNSYRWIITSEEACLFAEMAQALADSNIPSHAYLETEDGELGVILSKDEFEVP